jgi:lipopolysaccharide/colanic/teichoic acid biosynthesis glycosyltransferase
MGIAMPGLREIPSTRRRLSASAPKATDAFQPPAVAVPVATHMPTAGERLRRVLNYVLALLGLIVALPVLLLVALLIRLTSRGPVIYTQTRVGLDRRNPALDNANHRR